MHQRGLLDVHSNLDMKPTRHLALESVCNGHRLRKVVLKTGLKLNPKKLYGADGYAVKACVVEVVPCLALFGTTGKLQ